MNEKYLVRTIREPQILGKYFDEDTARTAMENFAEQYREDGLYLIRFDPIIREVITPKEPRK
jgi:hypothetical protein